MFQLATLSTTFVTWPYFIGKVRKLSFSSFKFSLLPFSNIFFRIYLRASHSSRHGDIVFRNCRFDSNLCGLCSSVSGGRDQLGVLACQTIINNRRCEKVILDLQVSFHQNEEDSVRTFASRRHCPLLTCTFSMIFSHELIMKCVFKVYSFTVELTPS